MTEKMVQQPGKIGRKNVNKTRLGKSSCKYCKQEGHTINQCPTRPLRTQHQRSESKSVERTFDFSKISWEPLTNNTNTANPVIGVWGSGETIEKLKNVADTN